MFDGELCGVGDGDGASGRSGSPAAEEETYSAAVCPCACKADPVETINSGTNSLTPRKLNNGFRKKGSKVDPAIQDRFPEVFAQLT